MRTVRVTLRPRSTVASQQTTRQAWANATGQFAFRRYDTIRNSAQIPEVFRKRSQWRTDSGREDGYYSHTEAEPNLFIPVEFDFDNVCWVEIRWITEPDTSVIADHWQAFQPAREELGLDITIEERDQYLAHDNSTPGSFRAPLNMSTHNTRAPSPATSSTSSRPSHINLFHSIISPQTQELIRLAEILHIDNAPMSQTITAQTQVGTIDPITGHMITEDDVAVNRAIGPDRADPPSRGSRRPFGGGLPSGGPPGGGYGPPGGPPGGGGGGGSPRVNLAPLPGIGAPRGSDKLIGNPPTIFNGDKNKSEEFSTQWQLYEGVNMTNNQMRVPFQRAMLFLTYLQGPLVNEWVKAMSAWLRNQITHNHIRLEDEWLWESTMQAFNRQFADVLEQEKAKALLRRGFRMEGGELDAYISKFEQTVRHAGLNQDDPLVLDKFTDGLPTKMYEDIYTHKRPHTYEQWRQEAIQQQKAFVHLRARLNSWRTTPTPTQRPIFNNQWRGAPRDSNAMDTSQGRVRSRLANAEVVLNNWKNGTDGRAGRANGPQRNNREVICYNCNKPGHIARSCTAPRLQRRQQFQPQYTPCPYNNRQMQPGPSRARRGETQFEYDYAPQIERGVLSQGVVDDRSNWGDAPDQNEQIARAVSAPSEQQQAEALKAHIGNAPDGVRIC